MNVKLIGASGFVGTRLLDLLKQSGGYQLQNIDLQPSPFFNDITVIGDARSQEDMDEKLAGADVVVLLAAQHRDDVSPVSLYYETNVGGLETTLRAMEKNGCKSIVFYSSVFDFEEDASFWCKIPSMLSFMFWLKEFERESFEGHFLKLGIIF